MRIESSIFRKMSNDVRCCILRVQKENWKDECRAGWIVRVKMWRIRIFQCPLWVVGWVEVSFLPIERSMPVLKDIKSPTLNAIWRSCVSSFSLRERSSVA